MIDTFWTKWRIRQLAGADALLAGKWLDDYARWLYGRLWYRCHRNPLEAQRLLEEIFLRAAGRLREFWAAKCPMSDWLLSIYEQTTVSLFPAGDPRHPDTELHKAIMGLSMQPLSETESFWPQLTELGQQALASLSCDEQRILLSRYFRLEGLADTAAQYGLSQSEIQTLLYRASHSFRRILETLTQTGLTQVAQSGQTNTAILETNLEKIFHTLILETPTSEFMAQLKEQVVAVLVQNRLKSGGDSYRKKLVLGISAAFLLVLLLILIWWGVNSPKNEGEQKIFTNGRLNNRRDTFESSSPDAAQEVQTAVRFGTAGDIEGLLGIMRSGTYPAQVTAAYYLGQYGDKSAINLLDQASQKWYAQNPTETNPFLEAIEAIENRIRQQAKEELEAKEALAKRKAVAENIKALLQKKNLLTEPNTASRQVIVAKDSQTVKHEPNQASKESEHAEPVLIVSIEPNQPPVIEQAEPNGFTPEPSQYPPEQDVNMPEPVGETDLSIPEETFF